MKSAPTLIPQMMRTIAGHRTGITASPVTYPQLATKSFAVLVQGSAIRTIMSLTAIAAWAIVIARSKAISRGKSHPRA